MTSQNSSSASGHVGDSHHGPPPFAWSHLWKPAIVNPVNLKSYTIPIFNLADPYAQSFHLSWREFLCFLPGRPLRIFASSWILRRVPLVVRFPTFNARGHQERSQVDECTGGQF